MNQAIWLCGLRMSVNYLFPACQNKTLDIFGYLGMRFTYQLIENCHAKLEKHGIYKVDKQIYRICYVNHLKFVEIVYNCLKILFILKHNFFTDETV